jgi:signal peptidase I
LPADPAIPAGGRRRRRRWKLAAYLGLLAVLARTFDAAVIARRARRGPWRAEVAERSMAPALLPGDWLLLDPTIRRWPRPGTVVVVREPGTGILAIKRVAARGAHRGGATPAPDGPGRRGAPPETLGPGHAGLERPLGPREAWVEGDAPDGSIDSRTYGPLDADDLVARAWFRYGPRGRVGRLLS